MEPVIAQRAPRKDGSTGFGSRGSSGPIISTIRQEAAELERIFGRRLFGGTVSVPVGGGRIPFLITRQGVFGLPSPATTSSQAAPLPPIDRRDIPSNEEVLPDPWSDIVKPVASSWFQYHENPGMYSPPGTVIASPQPAVYAPPPPAPPPPIKPDANGGTGPMDLGQLAGQLGVAYINARYGQEAPPPPAGGQQNVFSMTDLLSLAPDVPGVDLVPQAPSHGCGGSPVYKKVCGSYKWVNQKRRRRKRLATQSDLKDLAALKGILGTGKAFDVWIATHS